MGLFDDYKQTVETYFNIPVNEFRQKTKALDHNHHAAVTDFKNSIGKIFSNDVAFTGAAADALATIVGDYIRVEGPLTSYTSDDLSEILENTSRLGEKTVAHIREKLNELANGDPTNMVAQGGLIVFGVKITPALIFSTAFVALLVTLAIISLSEQHIMDDIEDSRQQWENDMLQQGEVVLTEPKLPPTPSDPSKILVPPWSNTTPLPSNLLSDDQRRLLEDIRQKLTADGVPFDESDLENLVQSGYSEADIRAIIDSIRRQYKNGTIDKACIQKILRGFNKTELTKVLPFSNPGLLRVHAGLHGGDFGLNSTTPADDLQYQQEALDFMKGPPGPNVIQLIRSNGEYVRWNTVTGEFGILKADGSLKTFLKRKPGNSGWDYLLRQVC